MTLYENCLYGDDDSSEREENVTILNASATKCSHFICMPHHCVTAGTLTTMARLVTAGGFWAGWVCSSSHCQGQGVCASGVLTPLWNDVFTGHNEQCY